MNETFESVSIRKRHAKCVPCLPKLCYVSECAMQKMDLKLKVKVSINSMDQGSTATFRKRNQHVMCWLPSPVLGGKVADNAEE
jgi:hypothetical protein